MENFIPVSRELLFSSLWRSLADKEAKILIDLMARAPYQPTTYNLYGVDIELSQYELCFSCVKMAEKYQVTEYFIRSLLKKLEVAEIIKKTTRKISRGNSRDNSRGNSRGKFAKEKIGSITAITFYSWVFGDKKPDIQVANENCKNHEAFLEANHEANRAHNIEVIKEEEKKEEYFYTHNACENKNGFQKASEIPGKTWYPIEQIASLEFPNAQRILAAWQKFSGQTNIQIAPLLRQYCKEQKDIDIHQMTLDILDFRFRKYMKQHFKIKKQVEEPVRVQNYIRIGK